METSPLTILHVDLDAFFASVEQLDDPALRGKPVLVGGDGPRGVVAAASYEARAFGCHSAMPMAVAKRNCPQAVVVHGRFERYRELSGQVFQIFNRFTPAIEPLSIDEAFLDLAGTERLHGDSVGVATRIRLLVSQETGLTASVGVSYCKFLAKLASDLDKPDGLTVIGPQDVSRVLPPLPVTRIWGIGPRTAARLEEIGVSTIGQMLALPVGLLRSRVGDEADHYRALAMGIDARRVIPDHAAKSVGQEQTFGQDLPDPQQVRDVLLEQSEQVTARLRRSKVAAKVVTVKIRYGNFRTITRRVTLGSPTNVTAEVWSAARGLFDAWAAAGFEPVRLIGVAGSGLEPATADPPTLFVDPSQVRQVKLDAAVDAINARFGGRAIHRSQRPRQDP